MIKSVKTPIGNFNASYSKAGLTAFEFISNQVSSYPVDQDLQKSVNIFFGKLQLQHLPIFDLDGSEFQLKVWHALCQIPWGKTESYKSLAKIIGSPGASRAVGTACRLNPVPLFIPCHRVIKHDGSIGKFALGIKNKRFLLELESQ